MIKKVKYMKPERTLKVQVHSIINWQLDLCYGALSNVPSLSVNWKCEISIFLIRKISIKYFLQGRSVLMVFPVYCLVYMASLQHGYISPNCGKYINLVLFFHCSIVSYKLSDILGVNVLCFPLGQIETISQSDTSLVPSLAAYIPPLL